MTQSSPGGNTLEEQPIDDAPDRGAVRKGEPFKQGGIDRVEQHLRRHRIPLIAAVTLALVSSLYVVDLVSGYGRIARGVVVAGTPIGGLDRSEAADALRPVLEAIATRPLMITAGGHDSSLDIRVVGLRPNLTVTLERASAQPLNPWTRLRSLVAAREIAVVTEVDSARLGAALEPFAATLARPATEGGVRFVGLEPIAVGPGAGQRLDLAAATTLIERDWWTGRPIALPLVEVSPLSSAAQVRETIDTVARPAMSAPVTVSADGTQAVIAPQVIAAALKFRLTDPAATTLTPEVDLAALTPAVAAQLASTVTPPRNAGVRFTGDAPTVIPGLDGRRIDYPATFAPMIDALTRAGPDRAITAVYLPQPARVTAEQLRRALGAGEISTFTTGGFAADSGQNIRRAAQLIDGAVVGPGETFSLNAATNPRDAQHGFVEAGIIEDGHPARGIGGGVSQIATTLYNAAYFAAMTDVEHQEHSYYISRYPVAREATVFNDVIDVKFRNDGPDPVVIHTVWTPASITVKILGQKTHEVNSTTGPRGNPSPPQRLTRSGPGCTPSQGKPGFTATDTRTTRDLRTGQTSTATRTVTYRPSPTVVCK